MRNWKDQTMKKVSRKNQTFIDVLNKYIQERKKHLTTILISVLKLSNTSHISCKSAKSLRLRTTFIEDNLKSTNTKKYDPSFLFLNQFHTGEFFQIVTFLNKDICFFSSDLHIKRIRMCIISASSMHHHCVISASSVHHQCIIGASACHHSCIIRA